MVSAEQLVPSVDFVQEPFIPAKMQAVHPVVEACPDQLLWAAPTTPECSSAVASEGFAERLAGMPLLNSTIETFSRVYESGKESSRLLKVGTRRRVPSCERRLTASLGQRRWSILCAR